MRGPLSGKGGGERKQTCPQAGQGQCSAVLLILALGRQRLVDLCEFKASLVYRVSSRTARIITQRNPVLTKQKKKKKVYQC